MTLRLAYVDSKAAQHAVLTWHYSKRMPLEPLVKVGVWEDGRYIGVVLFGRGAANNLGDAWGLQQTEVAELVRVALNKHAAPVSRIVSIATKLFRKASPGTRLLVSFADPSEGHHGGIYQAMGWTFTGRSATGKQYFYEGRWQHNREVTAGAFGKKGAKVSPAKLKTLPQRDRVGKLRYVLPLDKSLAGLVASRSQPYPKRGGSHETPGVQPGAGGESPTPPLHLSGGTP
jgi:hypothetical protein